MKTTKTVYLALLTVLLSPMAANADLLFVSDSESDQSIATVLTGDGYTVTSLINQYVSGSQETTALTDPLGIYDAVFWSATGDGGGSINGGATTLANLLSYVTGGGQLFVTGYDSIDSPDDPPLRAFLGGADSVDTLGDPGTVANLGTSLTTGVVDIRGVTQSPPESGGQTSDRDALGNLGSDTIGLVEDPNFAGFYQWTLRTVGAGEIAYVSNGNQSSSAATGMWVDTSTIYNAALRNFAFSASNATDVPEPGTLALLGLGLVGMAARRRKTV